MAEMKPGAFVHIEIASSDPARTRKFFEDLFEWEFEDVPEMSYATYMPKSGPGGGIMAPMENQPPGMLNYLLSADLDADLPRIEAAGGRILRPKMEIPNVGWWALFQEPTGIVLALFEPVRGTTLAQRRQERRAKTSRRSARGGKKAKGARRGRRGR